MAIRIVDQYPGKTAGVDTEYPQGKARNVTTPNDGTGTPWEAAIVNDDQGFKQALLNEAGIIPSGNPDTALSSQYLEALREVVLRTAIGKGQTSRDVTAQRVRGQTYTNPGPRPIQIYIFMNWTSNPDRATLTVGGFQLYKEVDLGIVGSHNPLYAVIEPGESYSLTADVTIRRWVERG